MKLLNLLIVEDSEDDTFLIIHHLKSYGFNPKYQRVENEAEMRESILDNNWDIVICDHALPSFSSTKALSILQEDHKDTPFIILSGEIDPKIAIESMRNGAKDFIMKDDVIRLIPAIERELKESVILKEKRLADAQIKHMAYHDCLTGLVNRLEFEKRLDKAVSSVKKKQQTDMLLYMDVDKFKHINDDCGHLAGDELLKQLASRLLVGLRDRDTLARMGGDEFCLLLNNCPPDKGMEIAQAIKDTVRDFNFQWNEKIFKVEISVGVIVIDENSGSSSHILSAVDMACYRAKEKKDNTVELYEATAEEFKKTQADINWSKSIDKAISSNEFKLFHQFIVPLQNDDLFPHHEILLRLEKDGEIILPNNFIPAAERCHKMVSVDFWVIENVFRMLKKTHEEQPEKDRPYFIAINLSGQTLAEPKLFPHIQRCIDIYEIDSQDICFEITEASAISNFKIAQDFFEKIKKIGCKLSLDNFGKGLSSFSYLKNMPVDFVKIDGHFVKNIIDDSMDRSIVEAINNISHKMGAKTVAKFVENNEIKRIITEMGVDYGQGFGIHKPEPFN